MTPSYGQLKAAVESARIDDASVSKATRAQIISAIRRSQLARIEETLDLVRDQPSSVQNVLEYGLGHPGGISAKEVEKALGLSDKTVKKAHKVLQERGLAHFESVHSRSGRTVRWSYETGLYGRNFVDLGMGKRGDLGMGNLGQGGSSPCQDHVITPTTCGNAQNLGQEGVGAYEESVSVVYRELSSETQSSSSRVSEGRTPLRRASRRRGPDPLAGEFWTTPELACAPALARYRELISARGYWVREEDASAIASQLYELVENHSLAVAQEFLDHVEENCAYPYSAKAMYTFERRWWSLDRAPQEPQPATPDGASQARSEALEANNARLRARVLARSA
ncbi:hypothetical protein ACIGG9_16170 [Pseudonocardia alni]|uniref:hypothetical protein n=1 Tax=Pseudonocardia alni TaxID=33907 RepID=UPI00340EF5CA